MRNTSYALRKIFLFIIHSVFISLVSFSQNLILNGSFEEENTCTEKWKECAPEAWVCTFNASNHYFKDAKIAFDGSHCIALEAGNSMKTYSRTLIRTPLVCQLRKDNIYRLSFYFKSSYPILDSIGIYFTTADFLFDERPSYKIQPALYAVNAKQNNLDDYEHWQEIVLNYTAAGDERFLTIGNFSRRDISRSSGIPVGAPFLVFLDNVSLTSSNPNEKLCPDWQTKRNEIYEQNDRHQLLERYITFYKNKPPLPKLSTTIMQSVDTIILPDILFSSGKADLKQNSFQMLNSFCSSLQGKLIDSLVITGHTDSIGTELLNEHLSINRALAVTNYINSQTNISGRIISKGMAGRNPIADNKTPAGRQLNRRVEIYTYIRQ